MSALADFHFLRPLWLLALLPCALLAASLWHYYRPRGNWQQAIDEELLPLLSADRVSQASRLPLLLTALGWLVAVLALAGPSWQKLPQPAFQKQDALIILLDLSPSMYAGDVSPSRLVQARREIRDILKQRQEGLTALIAYAGDAHVVTPLTDDTDTIELMLPALAPAMMPSIGNQPLRALELAAELAASGPGHSTRVLFITDEIPSADFSKLGKLAEKHQLKLAVLAIGTDAGAPIPLTQGGFLKNARGELVVARLNRREMADWASSIGARFQHSSFSDDDIDSLLRPALTEEQLEQADSRDTERQFDTWLDSGPWLVLALLPLALLAFRRGWLLGLCLASLLPANESHAWSWRDLWQTEDQQAQQALEQGEPERAAELFGDEQWRGVARYRAGDYPAAAEAFAGEDTGNGHYNRGNALARGGQLEAALEAYDRALQLDPDNTDAASNREQVEKLMQQQQQQQQNQQQSPQDEESKQEQQDSGEQSEQQRQEQQEQSGQDQSQQDQSQQPSQQQSQQQQQQGEPGQQDQQQQTPSPEGEDADPEKSGDQSSAEQALDAEPKSEADQEATPEPGEQKPSPEDERLKQWLRQIPDEPGDLLQRKFDYQYRQQQRRGGDTAEERY